MAKSELRKDEATSVVETPLMRLNIGSGEDYREDWFNLDYNYRYEPDVVHDLTDRDGWPFKDDEFNVVLASHVFEHLPDLEFQFQEAARVLKPEGRLKIKVPIGANAKTDMTHVHEWTVDSGLQFAQNYEDWVEDGQYQFDPSVPFDLVDRDVELTGHGPLAFMGPLGNLLLEHKETGVWTSVWPGTSGEVTFVFERRCP